MPRCRRFAARRTRPGTTIIDTASGITRTVTQSTGTENIAGIVGVAQLTGQAASQGLAALSNLVTILSINLALMNQLPIPMLDGGVILFRVTEIFLGRPVSAAAEASATRAGFAVLAIVLMLTTVRDLAGLGLLPWLARFWTPARAASLNQEDWSLPDVQAGDDAGVARMHLRK